MSYTPTDWKTGDVITADKLNNIEQGIVNAGGSSGSSDIYYVDVTYDDDEGYYYAPQGTYANITNALTAGKIPYLRANDIATAFYSGKDDIDGYYFSNIIYSSSTGSVFINVYIIIKTDAISIGSVKVNT